MFILIVFIFGQNTIPPIERNERGINWGKSTEEFFDDKNRKSVMLCWMSTVDPSKTEWPGLVSNLLA